jgi:hypothetical protein
MLSTWHPQPFSMVGLLNPWFLPAGTCGWKKRQSAKVLSC